MAKYPQVLIDHYREMMSVEEFRNHMAFLGAEDEDVICSLLKGGSAAEYPPAGKLKKEGGRRKNNKNEKNEKNKY